MSEDDLKEIIANLKTQRDELRVQVHLANAEIKDEWAAVEKKLDKAQDEFEHLLHDAGEATDELKKVLGIVGQELGEAYGRIRERVKNAT